AFHVVSQTGIHYRNGSLSKSMDGLPDGAPRGGDRFPWLRLKFHTGGPVEDIFEKLDDTRLNLIIIGQPALPDGELAFGDLLHTELIPDDPINDVELARAGIPRPSFFLVRPDGHVGFCGRRIEAGAVTRYVRENLHLIARGRHNN